MSVSDSVQYPTTEKSTHEQDFQELPDDMTSSSQQDISHSSGNAGSAELQHSLSDYASYIDSSGDFSAGASARIQRSVTVPASTTTTINLSGRKDMTDDFVAQSLAVSTQHRLEKFKDWSIITFKCAKQLISERFGRGSKTVDLDMSVKIDCLHDTHHKYCNVLRLARLLTQHYCQVVQTQRALGQSFSDLAQTSVDLQDEFRCNSETQTALALNGEILLNALNFFTSSVNTLCNKTMEDTMITIRQYENARLQYDAYRNELEHLQLSQKETSALQTRLEDSKRKCDEHRTKFDKLHSDVNIKLQFLNENKVKVMQKQLLLFHNAISAYFSGNASALEATLKQFNITLKSPNSAKPSWIEH